MTAARKGHDANPVVVIAPTRGWHNPALRELGRQRDLAYFFAWRDVKVRYKQTALGLSWAVLQPLITMALFFVVFHKLAGVPSAGVPYPAFAMAGVTAWVFVSNGFALAANGLVQNANLVSKVYFPRLALPVGSILGCSVDLAMCIAITLIVGLAYGVPVTLRLAVLPFALVVVLAVTVGLGLWLSALQVYYRDVRYVLPLFTQALLFATPIAYPPSVAHGVLGTVLAFNPVSAAVGACRWCLLGRGPLPLDQFGLSLAMSAALLATGLAYFLRVERAFADAV